MSTTATLSGVWFGEYTSNDEEIADNAFIAQLEEAGGGIAGTITERDIWMREGILKASVDGFRDGTAIWFAKTYDGSGGMTHTVEYSGTANADATEIIGSWTIPGYTGNFIMTRELFAGLDAEVQEFIAV